MRYRLLGTSGLRVSELCLGTMTFGEDWGWGSPREESKRVFDTFAEAGGNHRKNMMTACEASLKRLSTDYIDLYWVHAWDEITPVEETMRGLDDLVRSGKVLYVGVSDYPAWVVSRANAIAEFRGWTNFVGLQVEYSLIERTPERELLPMAASLGLTVAAWSPLGAGVLTGKYNKRSDEDKRLDKSQLRPVTDRDLRIAAVVCDVAKDVGRSPAQVALAWLRSNPNVIPIIGARKHEQLLDNMACLDLTLSEDHLRRLDEVSAIDLGFPGEFLARPFIRGLVHGQLWDSLDRPIRQPAVAAAKTQPAAEKRVEAVKLEEALAR